MAGDLLVWSLDFNVHPLCSTLAQRSGDSIAVLDEMILDNAHTVLACQAVLDKMHARMGARPVTLEVY